MDAHDVMEGCSMSESEKKQRRQRRSFRPEFKAGAVKLVLEEGKSVAAVARELDLTETALRKWVEQAKADKGQGKPGALTSEERVELSGLRKRVRQLEMERDLLKNAAAHSTGECKTLGSPG
ncbi:transposase [Corallococcus coralloides]|uniref:transposase n=1 Tax=Corallococcus coralloides TaxID=184914 RepID=UPI00384EF243